VFATMTGLAYLMPHAVFQAIGLRQAQPRFALSWKTDVLWVFAVAMSGMLTLLLAANIVRRPPAARAWADVQTLGSAVSIYRATFRTLPTNLTDLTAATVIWGVTGGPFLRSVPVAPSGWTGCSYTARPDGTFRSAPWVTARRSSSRRGRGHCKRPSVQRFYAIRVVEMPHCVLAVDLNSPCVRWRKCFKLS
jgi:hypothetical protein